MTQPNQVEPMNGEGMPIQGSKSRGSLFVEFQVYLPTLPSKELKTALEKFKSTYDSDTQRQEL